MLPHFHTCLFEPEKNEIDPLVFEDKLDKCWKNLLLKSEICSLLKLKAFRTCFVFLNIIYVFYSLRQINRKDSKSLKMNKSYNKVIHHFFEFKNR